MEIKVRAIVVAAIEFKDGSVEEREYNGVWCIKCEDFQDKVYDDIFEIMNDGYLCDVDCDDERIKKEILEGGEEITDFYYEDDTIPTIHILISAEKVGLE